MKKLFLIGLLAFVFAVSGLFAGEVIILKVKVEVANARVEPDPNSPVIKQILIGTLLESRGRLENWYEIVITDDKGKIVTAYIHANVVDVVSSQKGKVASKPEASKELVREEAPKSVLGTAPQRMVFEGNYSSGGVKLMGGFCNANITHSEAAGYDLTQWKKPLQVFLAGIGFEIGSRIALEVDILYFRKGVKFKGTINAPEMGYNGSFDMRNFVDEISLPVLLKLKLFPGSTPYVLGGGEIAYVLSNKAKYSISDESTGLTLSGSEDLKESTKEIDYGLVFGAGFELNTGIMALMIEGRYHMGLANVTKTSEKIPDMDEKDWIKTNAIVLLLGIRF